MRSKIQGRREWVVSHVSGIRGVISREEAKRELGGLLQDWEHALIRIEQLEAALREVVKEVPHIEYAASTLEHDGVSSGALREIAQHLRLVITIL